MPNNTNITYGYDADGRRVKQTVGSTVTNYQWDEASPYGDVVNEYNGSGSTLASYVLGGNQLISQTRGATTSYFLQDGQGSTRALTSTTGSVTDTYSYTAFGENFSRTGTTTNPYQYTGQQFDSLTSLYSLRARYYNPALGRFLSQDTYPVNFNNPIELNRYVYTGNSPIDRVDPSGQGFIDFGIQAKEEAETEIPAATSVGLGIASTSAVILYLLPAGEMGLFAALSVPVRIILASIILASVAGPAIAPQAYVSPQTQTQTQVQPQSQTLPALPPNKQQTPDSSFDISFGISNELPQFSLLASIKLGRKVLPWDLWPNYGLYPSSRDNSLPAPNGKVASRFIGGANTWSIRFPETSNPEAKIRFNLKYIEFGSEPGVTLWEYYLLKQQPLLWKRVVFYNWTFAEFENSNYKDYPEPLGVQFLASRLLQIESSPNYQKIQKLMGTNVP